MLGFLAEKAWPKMDFGMEFLRRFWSFENVLLRECPMECQRNAKRMLENGALENSSSVIIGWDIMDYCCRMLEC